MAVRSAISGHSVAGVVSSAETSVWMATDGIRSLINTMKSKGPKCDPCGTPRVMAGDEIQERCF